MKANNSNDLLSNILHRHFTQIITLHRILHNIKSLRGKSRRRSRMDRETRALPPIPEHATVISGRGWFSSFLSAMAFGETQEAHLAPAHGVNDTVRIWRRHFDVISPSWKLRVQDRSFRFTEASRHRHRTSWVLKAWRYVWRDARRAPRFQEKLHVPSTVAMIPFREDLPRFREKMIQSTSGEVSDKWARRKEDRARRCFLRNPSATKQNGNSLASENARWHSACDAEKSNTALAIWMNANLFGVHLTDALWRTWISNRASARLDLIARRCFKRLF